MKPESINLIESKQLKKSSESSVSMWQQNKLYPVKKCKHVLYIYSDVVAMSKLNQLQSIRETGLTVCFWILIKYLPLIHITVTKSIFNSRFLRSKCQNSINTVTLKHLKSLEITSIDNPMGKTQASHKLPLF